MICQGKESAQTCHAVVFRRRWRAEMFVRAGGRKRAHRVGFVSVERVVRTSYICTPSKPGCDAVCTSLTQRPHYGQTSQLCPIQQ